MKDFDFEKIHPALQNMREFLVEQGRILGFPGVLPAARPKPAPLKR